MPVNIKPRKPTEKNLCPQHVLRHMPHQPTKSNKQQQPTKQWPNLPNLIQEVPKKKLSLPYNLQRQ